MMALESDLTRHRSHSAEDLGFENHPTSLISTLRRTESCSVHSSCKLTENINSDSDLPGNNGKLESNVSDANTKSKSCKNVSRGGKMETDDEVCFICMSAFTLKSPATTIPCINGCNSTPVHAKCIYEWSERQKNSASCPLCRGPLGKVIYNPPDILKSCLLVMFGCRKAFVTLPIPRKVGVVRCYLYVERQSKLLGSGAQWKMYLQAPARLRYPLGPLPTADSPVSDDRLLLVARKRPLRQKANVGTVIDMSLDTDCRDFSVRGVRYVGSVRSSALGLEHTLVSPVQEPLLPSRVNRVDYVELGHIRYTQNRFGRAVGPRRMQLVLPNVTRPMTSSTSSCSYHEALAGNSLGDEEESDNEDQDNTCEWASTQSKWTTKAHRPASRSKTLKSFLKRRRDSSARQTNVIYASNREPYWLDQIGAYSLDFQGRVTLPSNKNFQLVTEERPNEVILQFGKVERKETFEIYTMDIQWPLSPLQAFGICLSACDRKLACA